MKKYILIIAVMVGMISYGQGYKKNVYNVGDKVGILTTTPKNDLHVMGSGILKVGSANDAGVIALGGDILNATAHVGIFRGSQNAVSGGNWLNLGGYAGISFATNTSELGSQSIAMTITNDGDIGINQTIPTEKLEVVGNIKLSGVLIGDESVDKSNLAVALKTKVALGDVSGTVDIDTSLGIHFTMNMTGNITEFTFSNLTNEELKTITLQITGNFTIAQPASVKGNWDGFDGTKTNQIQIYLFDISTPTFSSALLNW